MTGDPSNVLIPTNRNSYVFGGAIVNGGRTNRLLASGIVNGGGVPKVPVSRSDQPNDGNAPPKSMSTPSCVGSRAVTSAVNVE